MTEVSTARVQILSTPGCAGCARAKKLVAEVLPAFPGLDWQEVDLTEQPEVAARYGVMSVPAVVIDGRLEFTSVPKRDELRRRLARSQVRRSAVPARNEPRGLQ